MQNQLWTDRNTAKSAQEAFVQRNATSNKARCHPREAIFEIPEQAFDIFVENQKDALEAQNTPQKLTKGKRRSGAISN